MKVKKCNYKAWHGRNLFTIKMFMFGTRQYVSREDTRIDTLAITNLEKKALPRVVLQDIFKTEETLLRNVIPKM